MDCEFYGSQLAFEHAYHCKPFTRGNSHLESGNKILMPASALDLLAALSIDYPMMFEIKNYVTGSASHCGVLEFTAEEGFIVMPQWMMDNSQLREEDLVLLTSVSLPKGTYVKLQPHNKAFIELSNPKAVLEKILRNFSCLSDGDTIIIPHNDKKFYIDIVETKPSSAISVIQTDCEVDFATPLDYQEPEKTRSVVTCKDACSNVIINEKPKFRPFTGLARRLDGGVPETDLSPMLEDFTKMAIVDSRCETSPKATACKKSGKVIFGSAPIVTSKKNTPFIKGDMQEENFNKVKQKIEAFTGRMYKLMD